MATQRPSQPRHGSHFAGPSQQSARPQRKAATRRPTNRSASGRRARVNQRKSAQQSNNKIAIIIVILMVVLASAFAFFKFTGGFDSQEINKGQQVTVTIADGSGAKAMAETLYEAKVIESKKDFVDLVKKKGVAEKLKPGNYSFISGQDLDSIIDQLIEGPNSDIDKVTIAEGLTVAKTASVVEEKFGINKDDFIAQAKASNYQGEYPFLENAKEDSLEGFLYPKTYDFTGQKVTADSIIRAMLNQYKEEVEPLDFDGAIKRNDENYGVKLDRYQVLVLASIIEREGATPADFNTISSVFYNRMKQDMPLQSDATTEYLVGRSVTADDLKQENPYNTYLNKGLVPTPICSPSIDAIKAALNPDNTNYLYFFWDGHKNNFSTTYEEHQNVINNAG